MKICALFLGLTLFSFSCNEDSGQTSKPVVTNNTLDADMQGKILKFIAFLYNTDISNVTFNATTKKYFIKNEAVYIDQNAILELYATANEYRLNHE